MGNIGPTSSGSGFFVTNDGMILTNAHVVADAVKVEVKMPNGNKYEGVVVDIDPVTDLAAVQLIETSNVSFVRKTHYTAHCLSTGKPVSSFSLLHVIFWMLVPVGSFCGAVAVEFIHLSSFAFHQALLKFHYHSILDATQHPKDTAIPKQ